MAADQGWPVNPGGWEFPEVITGNYRPGKYSKFWQMENTGKYKILELFELKYAAIFHKFKLTAYISYCLCT